jgi:hypothetical protein
LTPCFRLKFTVQPSFLISGCHGYGQYGEDHLLFKKKYINYF